MTRPQITQRYKDLWAERKELMDLHREAREWPTHKRMARQHRMQMLEEEMMYEYMDVHELQQCKAHTLSSLGAWEPLPMRWAEGLQAALSANA